MAQQAAHAETLQLYVIVFRPGPAWKPGVPMAEQGLRPHGLYMKSLLDEGRLFAGGGFTDRGGGLAIVRAASMEDAQSIYAVDPAVTSGIFEGDVMQWKPRFHVPESLVAH